MATDPLELIAHLFGIDTEELRQLATDDAGNPEPEFPSRFLGIDLSLLSDLQAVSDRDDVEWDAVFDADVSQIDSSTKSPRRSRHGIGIRPNRRRSPADQSRKKHDGQERWRCPTCQQEFLSHRALQRHYDANPSHPQAILDVQDGEPKQDESGWIDAEWVEFDDRIETFIALSEEVEQEDITVTYHPSDERVEIVGEHEETIDTSRITDGIKGDVAWRLSGRYLMISFPTQENGSSTKDEGV